MTPLVLAARPIPQAPDHLRRYVGLPWSGGIPEVWAYEYFDAIPDVSPAHVLPVDVVAAAALHPGLRRPDLAWFSYQRSTVEAFLEDLDDVDLTVANVSCLDVLPDVAASGTGVDLSLLTKVLHRKRPRLIPMLDRRVTDWYRFVLAARGAAAWPELTRALARDLATNEDALIELQRLVPLSRLRIADIAIWMESAP